MRLYLKAINLRVQILPFGFYRVGLPNLHWPRCTRSLLARAFAPTERTGSYFYCGLHIFLPTSLETLLFSSGLSQDFIDGGSIARFILARIGITHKCSQRPGVHPLYLKGRKIQMDNRLDASLFGAHFTMKFEGLKLCRHAFFGYRSSSAVAATIGNSGGINASWAATLVMAHS